MRMSRLNMTAARSSWSMMSSSTGLMILQPSALVSPEPRWIQAKGPIVLTQFTNAKFGQIMWLHLVTPGNKMVEVNSQKGDTLSSGPNAYDGPTVKYELNKTYHVTVNYEAENKLLSMKVNEKTSGKDIWSYYVNTGEELHGMNRIYLGSKGDYGMMGRYAQGYIDNVRLTVPVCGTNSCRDDACCGDSLHNPANRQNPPVQNLSAVHQRPIRLQPSPRQHQSFRLLPLALQGSVSVCSPCSAGNNLFFIVSTNFLKRNVLVFLKVC